ncbi:pyridoxal-phosphate dependent enzyme [Paenibacillus nasutitermitis]|uniref:Threonine synthase n=1 Tax=Paenibacillus nasutitermitis TaxID=1652958 RepID=A0A916YNN3_9BACL|nr:pyridoxal-phosphate dependent enzyme [Paenibacillus nasutitermitis]GGD51817.1 threonine synthase [Paenibacillus nasutitermitis]
MSMNNRGSGIWLYAERLPHVSEQHLVTLGEGRVPLVRSWRIGEKLGLPNLYFKLESLNPTGSYKDRISALALSLAREQGKTACIGTTSGNAGASVAAYAARAGLPYHVYVQENIIQSKLEQILVHHAHVYKVEGMGFNSQVGQQVFENVRTKAAANNWEAVITAFAYAPQAMEAVKTISFEIQEELGTPDAVFVPVGGGGLLAGIHSGFSDMLVSGQASRLPKIAACQSSGCANLVRGWEQGLNKPVPGDSTSLISGIQVPNPPDADLVFSALRESGGFGTALQDEATWHWQELLAVEEGIFCEPAGAIGLAGAVQALQEGRISGNDTVVVIISGAGYKDVHRTKVMTEHAHVPIISANEM